MADADRHTGQCHDACTGERDSQIQSWTTGCVCSCHFPLRGAE